MFKYSQTLTQLEQQTEQAKSDDSLYCLSIYLPFDQESQNSSEFTVVNTKFKSLVEIEVQKHLVLTEQKQLRLYIIDKIAGISSTFDTTQKGVCVYVTFRVGSEYRGGNDKNLDDNLVSFIQVVPLFTLPSKNSSAFIGKYFDLIGLLDNLNYDKPRLVVDIHQDNASLYEFSQLQLKQLSKVENSYEKFPEREEYLDQGKGNNSNRKDFNYEEDYLHQFLKDDLTKSIAQYTDQYKSIILVCPEQYGLQISKFSDGLGSHFSEIKTLFITTDKTPDLLPDTINTMVNEEIENSKNDISKELNSTSNNFETDLQVILEAAQNGRVEALYVAPDYHTPGFVEVQEDHGEDGEELKTVDGKVLQTNEAVLFIIQKVSEFGGKVVVVTRDLLNEKSNTIFARFRF